MKRFPNAIPAEGRQAVLYLRVSTEEQVDNFSLDTQEEICRKEASKKGYRVVHVFREEGRSAKTIKGRPELIQMIDYCRRKTNKIDAVFVYRIDRISRQTSDYLVIRKKLAEKGTVVISTSEPTGDSPTERLIETMMAGFAQLDNDIRSEQAKNGLRARFLSGLTSGKIPIGYKRVNQLPVKDPETWDQVKAAWDLMATGSKSLREIADIMNQSGLRIIRKNQKFKLTAKTTQRIFRAKFYMGIITSKKYPEQVKGQHVPMITEQQFYRVQAILDGRNPNIIALSKRSHTNKHFPLRRIVKCGRCGVGLTAAFSTGKTGKKYGYYRCGGKCNHISIKAQDLEDALIQRLQEITPTKESLDLFINFITRTFMERQSTLLKLQQQADSEIARIKELRNTLVQKHMEGIYSDEIFQDQNNILEDRMTKAQIAKEDATLDNYNIEDITTFLRTRLADLGQTYQDSSISQLKVLLSSTFPKKLEWHYDAGLKAEISPMYEIIRNFSKQSMAYGAGNGTWLEPI